MCGRYALKYNSNELPSQFETFHLEVHPQIARGENHERSYNVAPTTNGAVYRAKDKVLRYMKWGLVPHWTKNLAEFKTYRTFNARLESLQESRMWIQCCNNKRCVVPISGYYEWKTTGKTKIPYYVTRSDDTLLFLAGMYDYLENDDLWTYTIVTSVAPKELSWLHNRMPIVLEPGSAAWKMWMDPDKTEWTQKELNDLLAARYDDKVMHVYQVSPDVGKVANNEEYLTKPILKEDKDKVDMETQGETGSSSVIKKENVKDEHPTIADDVKAEEKETEEPSNSKKKRNILHMLSSQSMESKKKRRRK